MEYSEEENRNVIMSSADVTNDNDETFDQKLSTDSHRLKHDDNNLTNLTNVAKDSSTYDARQVLYDVKINNSSDKKDLLIKPEKAEVTSGAASTYDVRQVLYDDQQNNSPNKKDLLTKHEKAVAPDLSPSINLNAQAPFDITFPNEHALINKDFVSQPGRTEFQELGAVSEVHSSQSSNFSNFDELSKQHLEKFVISTPHLTLKLDDAQNDAMHLEDDHGMQEKQGAVDSSSIQLLATSLVTDAVSEALDTVSQPGASQLNIEDKRLTPEPDMDNTSMILKRNVNKNIKIAMPLEVASEIKDNLTVKDNLTEMSDVSDDESALPMSTYHIDDIDDVLGAVEDDLNKLEKTDGLDDKDLIEEVSRNLVRGVVQSGIENVVKSANELSERDNNPDANINDEYVRLSSYPSFGDEIKGVSVEINESDKQEAESNNDLIEELSRGLVTHAVQSASDVVARSVDDHNEFSENAGDSNYLSMDFKLIQTKDIPKSDTDNIIVTDNTVFGDSKDAFGEIKNISNVDKNFMLPMSSNIPGFADNIPSDEFGLNESSQILAKSNPNSSEDLSSWEVVDSASNSSATDHAIDEIKADNVEQLLATNDATNITDDIQTSSLNKGEKKSNASSIDSFEEFLLDINKEITKPTSEKINTESLKEDRNALFQQGNDFGEDFNQQESVISNNITDTEVDNKSPNDKLFEKFLENINMELTKPTSEKINAESLKEDRNALFEQGNDFGKDFITQEPVISKNITDTEVDNKSPNDRRFEFDSTGDTFSMGIAEGAGSALEALDVNTGLKTIVPGSHFHDFSQNLDEDSASLSSYGATPFEDNFDNIEVKQNEFESSSDLVKELSKSLVADAVQSATKIIEQSFDEDNKHDYNIDSEFKMDIDAHDLANQKFLHEPDNVDVKALTKVDDDLSNKINNDDDDNNDDDNKDENLVSLMSNSSSDTDGDMSSVDGLYELDKVAVRKDAQFDEDLPKGLVGETVQSASELVSKAVESDRSRPLGEKFSIDYDNDLVSSIKTVEVKDAFSGVEICSNDYKTKDREENTGAMMGREDAGKIEDLDNNDFFEELSRGLVRNAVQSASEIISNLKEDIHNLENNLNEECVMPQLLTDENVLPSDDKKKESEREIDFVKEPSLLTQLTPSIYANAEIPAMKDSRSVHAGGSELDSIELTNDSDLFEELSKNIVSGAVLSASETVAQSADAVRSDNIDKDNDDKDVQPWSKEVVSGVSEPRSDIDDLFEFDKTGTADDMESMNEFSRDYFKDSMKSSEIALDPADICTEAFSEHGHHHTKYLHCDDQNKSLKSDDAIEIEDQIRVVDVDFPEQENAKQKNNLFHNFSEVSDRNIILLTSSTVHQSVDEHKDDGLKHDYAIKDNVHEDDILEHSHDIKGFDGHGFNDTERKEESYKHGYDFKDDFKDILQKDENLKHDNDLKDVNEGEIIALMPHNTTDFRDLRCSDERLASSIFAESADEHRDEGLGHGHSFEDIMNTDESFEHGHDFKDIVHKDEGLKHGHSFEDIMHKDDSFERDDDVEHKKESLEKDENFEHDRDFKDIADKDEKLEYGHDLKDGQEGEIILLTPSNATHLTDDITQIDDNINNFRQQGTEDKIDSTEKLPVGVDANADAKFWDNFDNEFADKEIGKFTSNKVTEFEDDFGYVDKSFSDDAFKKIAEENVQAIQSFSDRFDNDVGSSPSEVVTKSDNLHKNNESADFKDRLPADENISLSSVNVAGAFELDFGIVGNDLREPDLKKSFSDNDPFAELSKVADKELVQSVLETNRETSNANTNALLHIYNDDDNDQDVIEEISRGLVASVVESASERVAQLDNVHKDLLSTVQTELNTVATDFNVHFDLDIDKSVHEVEKAKILKNTASNEGLIRSFDVGFNEDFEDSDLNKKNSHLVEFPMNFPKEAVQSSSDIAAHAKVCEVSSDVFSDRLHAQIIDPTSMITVGEFLKENPEISNSPVLKSDENAELSVSGKLFDNPGIDNLNDQSKKDAVAETDWSPHVPLVVAGYDRFQKYENTSSEDEIVSKDLPINSQSRFEELGQSAEVINEKSFPGAESPQEQHCDSPRELSVLFPAEIIGAIPTAMDEKSQAEPVAESQFRSDLDTEPFAENDEFREKIGAQYPAEKIEVEHFSSDKDSLLVLDTTVINDDGELVNKPFEKIVQETMQPNSEILKEPSQTPEIESRNTAIIDEYLKTADVHLADRDSYGAKTDMDFVNELLADSNEADLQDNSEIIAAPIGAKTQSTVMYSYDLSDQLSDKETVELVSQNNNANGEGSQISTNEKILEGDENEMADNIGSSDIFSGRLHAQVDDPTTDSYPVGDESLKKSDENNELLVSSNLFDKPDIDDSNDQSKKDVVPETGWSPHVPLVVAGYDRFNKYENTEDEIVSNDLPVNSPSTFEDPGKSVEVNSEKSFPGAGSSQEKYDDSPRELSVQFPSEVIGAIPAMMGDKSQKGLVAESQFRLDLGTDPFAEKDEYLEKISAEYPAEKTSVEYFSSDQDPLSMLGKAGNLETSPEGAIVKKSGTTIINDGGELVETPFENIAKETVKSKSETFNEPSLTPELESCNDAIMDEYLKTADFHLGDRDSQASKTNVDFVNRLLTDSDNAELHDSSQTVAVPVSAKAQSTVMDLDDMLEQDIDDFNDYRKKDVVAETDWSPHVPLVVAGYDRFWKYENTDIEDEIASKDLPENSQSPFEEPVKFVEVINPESFPVAGESHHEKHGDCPKEFSVQFPVEISGAIPITMDEKSQAKLAAESQFRIDLGTEPFAEKDESLEKIGAESPVEKIDVEHPTEMGVDFLTQFGIQSPSKVGADLRPEIDGDFLAEIGNSQTGTGISLPAELKAGPLAERGYKSLTEGSSVEENPESNVEIINAPIETNNDPANVLNNDEDISSLIDNKNSSGFDDDVISLNDKSREASNVLSNVDAMEDFFRHRRLSDLESASEINAHTAKEKQYDANLDVDVNVEENIPFATYRATDIENVRKSVDDSLQEWGKMGIITDRDELEDFSKDLVREVVQAASDLVEQPVDTETNFGQLGDQPNIEVDNDSADKEKFSPRMPDNVDDNTDINIDENITPFATYSATDIENVRKSVDDSLKEWGNMGIVTDQEALEDFSKDLVREVVQSASDVVQSADTGTDSMKESHLPNVEDDLNIVPMNSNNTADVNYVNIEADEITKAAKLFDNVSNDTNMVNNAQPAYSDKHSEAHVDRDLENDLINNENFAPRAADNTIDGEDRNNFVNDSLNEGDKRETGDNLESAGDIAKGLVTDAVQSASDIVAQSPGGLADDLKPQDPLPEHVDDIEGSQTSSSQQFADLSPDALLTVGQSPKFQESKPNDLDAKDLPKPVDDDELRDRPVNEALTRELSETGEISRSPSKNKSAADNRMYNVFTFLDNEGDSDHEGEADYGLNRTNRSQAPDVVNGATATNAQRYSEVELDDSKIKEPKHLEVNVADDTALHDKKGAEKHSAFTRPTTLEPQAEQQRGAVPKLNLSQLDGPSVIDQSDPSQRDISRRTIEDINSPDALTSPGFDDNAGWSESPTAAPIAPIPEYSAREEHQDNKDWRVVEISDKSYRVDMKAIDPYKKVLSHGGYYQNGLNAIIVFSACHLPEKSQPQYDYIMDNLFLFVVSTLELLVTDDYTIVYFHSGSARQKLPSLRWFKRCYDMVDRRLKKNLRNLFIVHPTIFLKTVLLMTKPFIRADRKQNPRTPSPVKRFTNY